MTSRPPTPATRRWRSLRTARARDGAAVRRRASRPLDAGDGRPRARRTRSSPTRPRPRADPHDRPRRGSATSDRLAESGRPRVVVQARPREAACASGARAFALGDSSRRSCDPRRAAAASGATPRGAEGRRLLLAEDNLINQKVAVAMLTSAGYRVDTVLNGARSGAGGRHADYDAILMDCQMPEMNGYEATAAIRAPRRRRAAHADHRDDRRRAPRGPRALPGRGHGQLPRQAGQQGRAARTRGAVPVEHDPALDGALARSEGGWRPERDTGRVRRLGSAAQFARQARRADQDPAGRAATR